MYRNVFELKTDERVGIYDITQEVEYILEKSGMKNGLVNVYSRHSTSGIVINENESGLVEDYKETLLELIPSDKNYKHNKIDNNADSHIRSFFIGNSQTIPLDRGRLDLGTWQSIFFIELDGPRSRKIAVTVIGE